MDFTQNEEGDFFYESASPFEFIDILNSTKQQNHQVFGTLILPEEKKDSYPLVICMHGSMGWGISSQDHSINFLENGFAIFKVHSFESRNVKTIYQDQMQVTVSMSLSPLLTYLMKWIEQIRMKSISLAFSLGFKDTISLLLESITSLHTLTRV